MPFARALIRASHPEPTVVVTVVAAMLALSAGHGAWTIVLLVAAVFTGQLTVGWSNDLVDAGRDAQAGRTDKPLATGRLARSTLRNALILATAACVGLSLAAGVIAGLVHLGLVALAWGYNVGLKRTWWSWLPYTLAFGFLPAFVWLAHDTPQLPPWWVMVVGALLGFGAHLLNALPDFDDDALTGVHGLPHRLGAVRSSVLAVLALVVGTTFVVLAPTGPSPWWGWAILAGSIAVSIAALLRGGRAPFGAAMVIAVLNVVLLVARS